MKIQGSNILITGGSRGLGLALAHKLGALGAKIVIVARNRIALDQAVARLGESGIQAHGIATDIGSKESITAVAARAAALVGDIDILINNASSLGATPLRLLLDTDCEDLSAVLEVNLVGPFRLTKIIVGNMALRGRGTVINISSDAAVSAYATWGAYSASKAALDHLTRVWAEELADTGVHFMAIDPGEMNTRMHADAMPHADTEALAKPEAVAARIAAALMTSPPEVRFEANAFEASS